MADRNSQLPTGSLKQKLIRRFIAAYERQNPGTTVKIAEPRMHLPGGPDPFTYAWEVIAVRPDSTILTALVAAVRPKGKKRTKRSEEHTSELQSLMRISYAVFCLKKKKKTQQKSDTDIYTTRHLRHS